MYIKSQLKSIYTLIGVSPDFIKHGHHHVYPRSTSSDDDLIVPFTATSHNSWFHHLQATTRRYTCGLSSYELQFITQDGVPNMNHNLYSQHKISTILAITRNSLIKWRPSVRATTHTFTLVLTHHATTWDRHMFTHHYEPS